MMKKLISMLLLCMLLTGALAAASAECSNMSMPGYTAVMYESFESGLPSGWLNIDADGDGYKWSYSGDEYYEGSLMKCCNGACVMLSHSYYNGYGTVTPDNWLVMSAHRLGSDNKLTFRVVGQDEKYAAEVFGVFVSTNTANPADTRKYVQVGGDYTATKDWQTITVDLSAYAGQKVNIAIRHYNVTDEYILSVDCVTLWAPEGQQTPPQTGDAADFALWTCMLLAGAAALLVLRRKQSA